MARRGDVMEAIASELAIVINNETSVSSEYEHVGPLNKHGDATYPYLGIEIIGYEVQDDGLGGKESLAAENFSNGTLDSRKYRTALTLIIDIAVLVDDYNVQLRDNLYAAVDERFTAYEGTRKAPSELQTDVTDVVSHGFENAFTAIDGVKGDRLRIEVSYERFTKVTDIPVAETVNVDIDSEGVDTPYPDTTLE